MGIHDRDYYRGATRGSLHFGGASPMVWRLIVINAIVFVLQLVVTGQQRVTLDGDAFPGFRESYVVPISHVTEWLKLDTSAVLEHGQVWRLVTYAFCHDTHSLWHLIFNMLVLWWAGQAIEAIYGSREFLAFYLTAALVAGLGDIGLALALRHWHSTVGASGAVMAVFTVFALYHPTRTVLFFYVIPIEVRWLLLLYVAQDLYPVIQALGGQTSFDGVAHAAHLGGAAYGFLYKRFDLRYGDLLNRDWSPARMWRSWGRRQQVRVYTPPPPEFDEPDFKEQVDVVLAKISSHGEASLTEQERALLKEASRRFKKTSQ